MNDRKKHSRFSDEAHRAEEKSQLTCPPGMDEEVFRCLPEDLQREVAEQTKEQLDAVFGFDRRSAKSSSPRSLETAPTWSPYLPYADMDSAPVPPPRAVSPPRPPVPMLPRDYQRQDRPRSPPKHRQASPGDDSPSSKPKDPLRKTTGSSSKSRRQDHLTSSTRIEHSSISSSRRRSESPPPGEADGRGDKPQRRRRSLGPSTNLADLRKMAREATAPERTSQTKMDNVEIEWVGWNANLSSAHPRSPVEHGDDISPIPDAFPSRSKKSKAREFSESSSRRLRSSDELDGREETTSRHRRSSSSTRIERSSKSSSRRRSESPPLGEADDRGDKATPRLRPLGQSSNVADLQKMARIATAVKQKSQMNMDNEEIDAKRVEWSADLYVIGKDKSSARLRSPEERGNSIITTYGHKSMQSFESNDIRPSTPLRRSSSVKSFGPKRKNTLIVDKTKRDTRWQWNQARVSRTFKPYRALLSEQDDLLPDNDDFAAFEASESAADKEFSNVRDAMLEDTDLTEREVAAFFEGFALFNVKIRSMQSQLDSLKAVKRSTARSVRSVKRRKSASSVKERSKSPSGRKSVRESKGRSGGSPVKEEATSSDEEPRMLGESLRVLSMKKEKKQHNSNEEIQRLITELEEADKKQKKLEKQLQQAGINIAEDIPYVEAKAQVGRIAKRMEEIGSSEVTHPDKVEQARLREEYFKLEQEMEKYNTALMLTDEYIEEQEEREHKWEEDHDEENKEALKKLRRHMPVDVKSMSEAQLSSQPTPNGKVLPTVIAKKFKRTNVLQIIRTDPEDLVRMHPSSLENLRVTGLTLTERRAIYAHIKDVGPRWKAMQADKMTERKWTWFKMMKQNFKENLSEYEYHVHQYGPPGNHPYATRDNPKDGCPFIGKQCLVKADKLIDYDNDYGYTDEAVYEVSNVTKADKEDPGARAMREALELARDKKANERSVGLKKHYKGKVLLVTQANGSCESMDEILDNIDALQSKWIQERVMNEGQDMTDSDISKELSAFTDALNELKLEVLPLAERSGMQLTGKKDANADQEDRRSPIELGLCEEVCEASADFFDGINERMVEIKAKDSRLRTTIEHLRELLDELHEKNLATLKDLNCERPAPSRKRKSRADLKREAMAKAFTTSTGNEHIGTQNDFGPPPAVVMGGRGGLMAAIAGRGGRGGGGGRGDLMSAIAGRGRGNTGGRGDLMSAIAGRGRGNAGGRGDLMSAIAGRGRGEAGGRGDLMAAIAGRGRGDAGGRGDLMAAIAGRGRGGGAGGRGDLMATIAGRGKVE